MQGKPEKNDVRRVISCIIKGIITELTEKRLITEEEAEELERRVGE